MLNLVELLFFISSNGGKFKLSVNYLPIVNVARCACLGADVTRGKHQKPFDGKIKYDYLMWIDSDIVFNTDLFLRLLKIDKPIVSGWYCQPSVGSDGSNLTPVVEQMDQQHWEKFGEYEHITALKMQEFKQPFKVDYIGFGWVLIKKGVFEKLEYPWFAPRLRKVNEEVQDLCSEDVAFCLDVKAKGLDVWVDPACRVGHEKTLVI